MAHQWGRSVCNLGLAGTLTVGGVLAMGDPTPAQLIPDATLGAESSTISPDEVIGGVLSDRVNGGAVRGINLFHSFLQFNVEAGRGVYFTNPVGIQNILTRVTGDSPSQILGRLGVDGAANLYLLNPNGILFGPDASLDVQGSFIASTADAIQIGDGFFSTTVPEVSPLLTVEPGALFLNSLTSQQSGITNQANLVAGQGLTLVAGNIGSSGQLQAAGLVSVEARAGNASIASVTAPTVNLFASVDLGVQNVAAGTATLTAGDNVALNGSQLQITGDLTVQASNGLFIGDSGTNPFNAQVGGNLRLEGGQGIDIQALNNPASLIQSGGSLDLISNGGSITAAALFNSGSNFSGDAATNLNLTESRVNATGNLTLTANTIQLQDSILNPLILNAGGTLGINGTQEITIDALSNAASRLQSGTDLTLNSNGGNIAARALFTSGGNFTATATAGDLNLNESQVNTVGNLTLTANTIQLQDSILNPLILNAGGSLSINGAQEVTIETLSNAVSLLQSGTDLNLDSSGIITVSALLTSGGNFAATATGLNLIQSQLTATENLNLSAINLILTESQLDTQGNMTLSASTVQLQDTALNPLILSAVGSLEIRGDQGINMQALMNNPASRIQSGSDLNLVSTGGAIEGRGSFSSGANLLFEAATNLNLTESQLVATAGNVTLRSQTVALSDTGTTPFTVNAGGDLLIQGSQGINIFTVNPGSLFQSVGDLSLFTDLSGNGSVTALTQFDAGGAFKINAGGNIFLPGGYTGPSLNFLSSNGSINIGAIDTSSTIGDGGDVALQAGGGITTGAIATFSVNGNAGNIFASAGGNIFTGGSVNASSQSGTGGNITFTSTNGAIDTRAGSLDTSSVNEPGGAVSLASNGTLITGAINTFSTNANAGNITLSSQTGAIDTTAGGLNSSSVFGNGGEITFNAGSNVTAGGMNSSSTNANAGDIRLTSTGGFVDTTAGNVFSNSTSGSGGNVSVTANGTITTATIGSFSINGNAGAIDLSSTNGGVNTTGGTLDASSEFGNGGNTSIFASSDIFTATINTSSGNANGGNIRLTSANSSIDTIAGILNSSANPSGGSGGNIFLEAANDIRAGAIQADGGAGGSISLVSRGNGNLVIADRTITSNTSGAGKGGDITIATNGTLSFFRSLIQSQVESGATGEGGSIFISGGSVLFDQTTLDTTTSGAGNGGSIFVTALNNGTVSLVNSTFQTTVDTGATGTGGDVEIKGGAVSLNGSFVRTGTRGIGRSGNISFLGDSFFLSGSRLDATTEGVGDAGNIDMIATGTIAFTNSSSANTEVSDTAAIGKGGNINFSAQNVFLTGGSLLRALTRGTGAAGNIQLTVPGLIEISGADGAGFYSGILTSSEEPGGVGFPGSGPGGNITINSPDQPQGTLRVSDGAVLSALTRSDAPGGNIEVYVSNLELLGGGQFTASATETSGGAAGSIDVKAVQGILISGTNPGFTPGGLNPNENGNSGIFTQSRGSGSAGKVTINTPWMLVRDNAEVSVATNGSGAGGGLDINATQFRVDTSARISASTSSIGEGGRIDIKSDQVEIGGNGAIAASTTGSGRGGALTISTKQLKVLTGGEISAATTGTGAGGQLTINANQIEVQTNGQMSASTSGLGKGGQMIINADQLRVQADGGISVSTSGPGDGGQLIIRVKQLVVDGGEIAASTFADGEGGQLIINTSQLEVQNNGKIAVSAFSSGNGGQLIIVADQIRVRSGGEIAASTFAGGNGGQLAVSAGEVSVDNGKISASTGGSGSGGQLVINARQVRVNNDGEIAASTSGSGTGGTLSIFAPESVELDSRGKLSTQSSAGGDAGSLSIFTRNLLVQNGAEATVSSTDTGNAGNLTVDARFVILNNGGKLSAETASGSGGNIQLSILETLQLNNFSEISASTKTGQGGTLSISANRAINLNNRSSLSARATGTENGSAGNLFLSTRQLTLQNDSEINTSATGQGNAGLIFAQAENLFLWSGSSITTRSAGAGNAGSINLQISDRIRLNRGEISASSEQGGGGNIGIAGRDIELKNSSLISTSVFRGDGGGGNISISASRIFTAFEDSDILANAVDGRGGRIEIRSPLFIADLFANVGANPGRDFSRFRGNGQVDISSASRFGVSGVVSIPDISFLQYSLDQLPDNFVPSEQIVAGSCLARRNVNQGSFVVAGTGGLPDNPYNPRKGYYPGIEPRSIGGGSSSTPASQPAPTSQFLPLPTPKTWQPGDPIQEAQGFLKTVDGRIILGTDAQLAVIARAQDIICDEAETKVSLSRVEGAGGQW
ncbi:filamentous hemagglutinin N-terminal domain-containing protein [Leptothermofonsia sichuanensis E412]|uniref:two-partner secretion domain-containing protein n=1 Tax=Leptothermofonsia sichuanensis TaxID=2917832 RepID=UPI001CA6A40C|nr:filamentous hemagglutinin N-terminal domain-containing protein [Leptothermofonsia sichuanensis]QZZ20484.1 filamentous hemagglutinin N-terminal domain-containing protein [Leptothermofonsia sichuanensis E412]